ncbi:MAG: apolipoprotein N-acyltransferase [Roseibium sp.]|nr:apolipoprotein N-acyltransferase [Roseibium sp.]
MTPFPGFFAVSALANVCLLSWGWRRSALAVLAGVVTALAMPPYDALVVLAVSLPCLVWLLDGAVSTADDRWRSRFWRGWSVGWWFGAGFFLAGLWWIGAAFLVEADRFAWMMPFAVLIMPAGLALFTGLALGVAAVAWTDNWSRLLLLAIVLSGSDWLRGHVLTGFPWNAFGYAVSDHLVLAQAASVFGVFGLGFWVVLIAATPATLIDAGRWAARVGPLTAGAVLLAVFAGFGLVRLHVVPDPGITDTDIRIVQPSVDQAEKWQPENRERIFSLLLDLTQRPLEGAARVGQNRIVVWPESAVPFLLTREPRALFRISQALNSQTELVTGAIRAEAGPDGPVYFNSVYLIASDGTVRDVYDKVRLVPFGEYLPLEPLLATLGITTLVDTPAGFGSGFRHMTLTPGNGPGFHPLICYEAIFPRFARSGPTRPGFLLNVTNDAWFGRTAGPYQHFYQASMRAIEQGLPLLRAANTGISAVVDAKGRVAAGLDLHEVGVVDVPLPGKFTMTIFGTYGDAVYGVFAILAGLLLIFNRYNRDSRKN